MRQQHHKPKAWPKADSSTSTTAYRTAIPLQVQELEG